MHQVEVQVQNTAVLCTPKFSKFPRMASISPYIACGVKVNLCLDDSSVFMKLEQG